MRRDGELSAEVRKIWFALNEESPNGMATVALYQCLKSYDYEHISETVLVLSAVRALGLMLNKLEGVTNDLIKNGPLPVVIVKEKASE